jgi:GNAT superfamily N-acetyltransferase
MTTRRMKASELPELLRLYAFLHPKDPVVVPTDPMARRIWDEITANPRLRYYVVEEQAQLVATCTLALIPNLTRGPKPYGLIENVVTDPDFRKRGFATAVLRHALNEAWDAGCYKVMLATGSKREETLRFYERAGFQRGVKTGFVAYPDTARS